MISFDFDQFTPVEEGKVAWFSPKFKEHFRYPLPKYSFFSIINHMWHSFLLRGILADHSCNCGEYLLEICGWRYVKLPCQRHSSNIDSLEIFHMVAAIRNASASRTCLFHAATYVQSKSQTIFTQRYGIQPYSYEFGGGRRGRSYSALPQLWRY